METKKEALNVQLMIMEGDKNDFEAQIYQLESREIVANQQIEELKIQVGELVERKESLMKKLDLDDKKRKEITHFLIKHAKFKIRCIIFR